MDARIIIKTDDMGLNERDEMLKVVEDLLRHAMDGDEEDVDIVYEENGHHVFILRSEELTRRQLDMIVNSLNGSDIKYEQGVVRLNIRGDFNVGIEAESKPGARI